MASLSLPWLRYISLTVETNDQDGASRSLQRPQAVLEHLLNAWITPIRFRVPTMPPISTTPAQIIGVVASREVTWTIIAATVLCIVGPMSTIILQNDLNDFYFWLAMTFAPFGVTYLSMLLAFLWTLFRNAADRTAPIQVFCAITTLLAATFFSLLVLLIFMLLPESFWPLSLRENPNEAFVIAALVPLLYLPPAMLLHILVYRFLVPVGSARWKELAHCIDAETVPKIAEKQIRNLLSVQSTQVISFGDKEIPINSIRMVEAQGNYVRLLTNDGEATIRKPFSKVMETLPNAQGIRLHRSRWVAYDAVIQVERERDGLFVTVDGQARIRVAKSRSDTVSKALATARVPRPSTTAPD